MIHTNTSVPPRSTLTKSSSTRRVQKHRNFNKIQKEINAIEKMLATPGLHKEIATELYAQLAKLYYKVSSCRASLHKDREQARVQMSGKGGDFDAESCRGDEGKTQEEQLYAADCAVQLQEERFARKERLAKEAAAAKETESEKRTKRAKELEGLPPVEVARILSLHTQKDLLDSGDLAGLAKFLEMTRP